MDFKLEVIGIPVSDVDVSKAFYTEQVGFELDHDVSPGNGMRVVQLTPPGSACSIAFGMGMGSGAPVTSIHLVVDDLEATRTALASRGLELSEIQDMGGGVRYAFFAD